MIVAVFLHIGIGLVHLFGSLAWATSASRAVALAIARLLRAACGSRRAGQHGRVLWASLAPQRRLGRVVIGSRDRCLPRPVDHPHDALLMEAIDVARAIPFC